MENSAHDFIPLYEELELLKNYLGLEKSRFQEKFNYEILIDELLDFQNLQIPQHVSGCRGTQERTYGDEHDEGVHV